MNRRLDCAAALLLLMLVAVPALGQAPLVVGSVRDQHGAAIVGAVVAGQTLRGSHPLATTDAVGTFALHAEGIVAVRIACRYCESALVAVTPGEPVVAIVRRYDALAGGAPSPADLENLPYAHVESSVALRPFTLLAQSSAPYPGAVLSDRGLSPAGSLLIDDGAANYDIATGESPYAFIPAQYEQSALVRNATNAYAYGDQAGGGIVELTPFVNGSNAEIATIGSDSIARAQVGSDSSAVAVGSFGNDQESRQRGDLFASWPLAAQESLTVTGGSEQGREYESPGSTFAGSFSFAHAAFSDPQALNLTVTAAMDRGGYETSGNPPNAYQLPLNIPDSVAWSDSGFDAAIHSSGPIVGFLEVGLRSSTGFYDAQASPYIVPRVGAMLDQTRADAGFAASGNDYNVTAAVGAFWLDYSGGTYGASEPARTALAVPSLDAQIFPNGKWSVNLQGSGSFMLPTFVDQYLYADDQALPVAIQRNALQAAALTYTDDARVRISFEQAWENVSGASSGRITSTGFAAIWQVAPAISLRAWTMHVTDTAPLYAAGIPYDGAAPTVNAFWLTYDTGSSAVRADLIYRRDLLDAMPFYHVDGAISGPIANRLRWYAGTEDRMHRTFIDLGLRFAGR